MSKENTDENFLLNELVKSKAIIEKNIQIPITSFCSVNNSLISVNDFAKKIIEENYQYHFTTIAGSNNENPDTQFIKRINVECFWMKGAIKFSIGGVNLKRSLNNIIAYKNV
jgi:hypothetical protein